jgi:hypothetical protein
MIREPFGGNTENTVVVSSLEQFGEAVNGVITLADNATYIISGTIDLLGKRIVCGTNNSIFGYGSENCILKSTGLTSQYLLTSQYSLQLNFVTITAAKAVNLNAIDSDQTLDWVRVNFTNCAEIGIIKDFSNFIGETLGILNSDKFTFDGTIGTIGMTNTIFSGTGTDKIVILPSTLTITRRFRVLYSSFICTGTATGIDVDNATIPTEGFILDTVNFSGGATYLNGINNTSNDALILNTKGISNSGNIGQYYMQDNVTATTITVEDTYYKVSGTTTVGQYIEKFTHTNNRLTYVGAFIGYFKVSAFMSVTSGNNNVIAFRVAKNGTTIAQSTSKSTTSGAGRSENIKLSDIVELNTNDYIEVFVTNTSGTNVVTVESLNLICERLS